VARDEVPCRITNAEKLAGKNMYDLLVALNNAMGENSANKCIIGFISSMTEDEADDWCRHMSGCADCLQKFLHSREAPGLII